MSPIQPPQFVIDQAVRVASFSPCAKSKRGVVLYWPNGILATGHDVVSAAHNGPPGDLACGPSCRLPSPDPNRSTCALRCVHAEVRAIREAPGDSRHGADAVHVKVVDGKLVAGGGPSCAECAREVLDAGLAGFWLFESPSGIEYTRSDPLAPGVWRRYTAAEFHRISLAAAKLPAFEP